MGIANLVVLITGAGSGLGAAAAESFAKQGAKVVLCGRRKHKIAEVAERIVAAGGHALTVQADVTNEADMQRLVRTARETYGRVDVLINNAGFFEAGNVLETSLADWNQQLATNLTGPFLAAKACLPVFRAQQFGRIINITSGLAENGAGGFAAYSAAKAGLESLTRTLAEDESANGILCNMFSPGTLKTEMHATGNDPSTVVDQLLRLADLPVGGMTGQLVRA